MEWPRGEATACKAVYTGSNPVSTSIVSPVSNTKGRLAQGLARFLDTEEVTGSIPVSPTEYVFRLVPGVSLTSALPVPQRAFRLTSYGRFIRLRQEGTTMKGTTRTALGVAAIGALLVSGAAPAMANVERRGMCSAASTWEADADREFEFFELDFEVNTPNADENWRLVIRQNGKTIYTETRPATRDFDDRLADVDWSTTARDKSGVRDRFEFTAKNQVTNETCKATVRI